ncbi:hypothetical protein MXAN_7099 [Myxococcus xanthus DK 1622]|uniref:Uncharacterized protein n=1 Tax=Myxococcus xanthus (strain DK1622) TaxID=246197 RepID=Q1CWL1_MYXXD|nr:MULTISPECIES: hypothetical protein [Myxococcus]ABF88862.1 hypothetical protein MXAN_7099 [Myxococcus xanthus DK 1622]NOJ52736.1 hypothetical protein [Myxococcus xanthus]QPM79367.1 hypothetical protein I5Q59_34945 [Myxococcus xanthus]QVW68446.1 hypothetical protein JTM82_02475 [Myxococcus xanthus DZ2]UEO05441.1 hypothetical protein K1515_02505 [Myxococcus xanthus DZ2]
MEGDDAASTHRIAYEARSLADFEAGLVQLASEKKPARSQACGRTSARAV